MTEEQPRTDSGQFTAVGEHLTGEAGLEAADGYRPMPSAEKEEQPEYATAREAADALAEQEQPATDVVVYFDRQSGERLNDDLREGPVETIKLERAADDLAGYESQVVDNRAASIDSTFQAAIDKMRSDAVEANPGIEKELEIPPV